MTNPATNVMTDKLMAEAGKEKQNWRPIEEANIYFSKHFLEELAARDPDLILRLQENAHPSADPRKAPLLNGLAGLNRAISYHELSKSLHTVFDIYHHTTIDAPENTQEYVAMELAEILSYPVTRMAGRTGWYKGINQANEVRRELALALTDGDIQRIARAIQAVGETHHSFTNPPQILD